jgi:hypothetical protein
MKTINMEINMYIYMYNLLNILQKLAKVLYRFVLTINVPVVFMGRYVMVLRGATSLQGAMEGVGPENQDFFGP